MKSISLKQKSTIAEVLSCEIDDIIILDNIDTCMTNSNVVIQVDNKKYVVRLPGNGTSDVISRTQEHAIYEALILAGLDDITLHCDENGIKISKYIENVTNCNPSSEHDVSACMREMKRIHKFKLKPEINKNSLFESLNYFNRLAFNDTNTQIHKDYSDVYSKVVQIHNWIELLPKDECLTNFDAAHINFIFDPKSSKPRMIDWEYGCLQDPHLDIAMFCLYAEYAIEQSSRVIDLYFETKIDNTTRYKILGYCAIAALQWYNWAIHMKNHGAEYGDYSDRQFELARAYANHVLKYLDANRTFDVRSAVIMAAGRGSRINELSVNTPKPLLKVHDEVLIERLIQQLNAIGIHDIYVATGYKHEMFEYLESKYDVRLCYNADWSIANNIVSFVYTVEQMPRHLLKHGTILLESDVYIANIDVLKTRIAKSSYYIEKCDDAQRCLLEWIVDFDENTKNIIDVCMKYEKTKGYILRGVSHWTPYDLFRLYNEAEYRLSKGLNFDNFIDDVALKLCKEHFDLHVNIGNKNDVLEIDTLLDYEYANTEVNK